TTATGSSSNPSLPDCWSYIDDVTSTGYGYTIASTPLSSPNTFRLYRTNSTTNSTQELVLVSPETNNLGNGTPKQLRFYMRSYSTTTYDNKLEILSIPSATSTAGATILATITNTGVTGQNWQEYIVPCPTSTIDDYFGFRLAYNGTTAASSVVLDDIYLEDLETCMYPDNIAISNITSTGADISWTPSPQSTGGTGYEYEIRTSGAPGSGTTGLETSGNTTNLSVTISALDPNTDYEVYVRSLCGTATSRWSQAVMFKTLCATFGNFSENFDNTSTGSASKTGANYPDCWNYIDSTTTGYGYVVASNPQSSPRVYRLYRANTASGASTEEIVLVSPPTDNLGNGTKQLRFSIRSYATTTYNSKLEILSMPDPTTTTGATVLATINNNNDRVWAEYIVSLPV